MNQYAVFIDSTSVTPITGIVGGVGPWPGALITSPRDFKYNTTTYTLNQEGVYKFSVPTQNTTNMIIYNGDVLKLMESLAYMAVSGQDDSNKTIAQLNSKALTSRIHILCGQTSAWVKSWCDILGIPCRIVNLVRGDSPNNFYDGHVVNEVKINGEWKLFDINIGFKFEGAQGNLLALKDVCPVNDTSIFKKLHAFKDMLPSEPMSNNVYHHSSTIDMFLASETMLLDWQKDIMQIPGILHTDGLTYFYMPTGYASKQSWVLSLSPSYRVIPYASWLSMFY